MPVTVGAGRDRRNPGTSPVMDDDKLCRLTGVFLAAMAAGGVEWEFRSTYRVLEATAAEVGVLCGMTGDEVVSGYMSEEGMRRKAARTLASMDRA